MRKWRRSWLPPQWEWEVNWTSLDIICMPIDHCFALLPLIYNIYRCKTPIESESDNAEEWPLCSFPMKHNFSLTVASGNKRQKYSRTTSERLANTTLESLYFVIFRLWAKIFHWRAWLGSRWKLDWNSVRIEAWIQLKLTELKSESQSQSNGKREERLTP